MVCLEGGKTVGQLPVSTEIQDGTIFDGSKESSSPSGSELGRKA